MNVEELLTQNLANQIDHDIFLEIFSEAGMSEESIKEFSDSFWYRVECEMKRKIGDITNEDVHMPKTDDSLRSE